MNLLKKIIDQPINLLLVRITFGNFDDLFGTTRINEEKFGIILNHMKNKMRYIHLNWICYKYKNKLLKINPKNKAKKIIQEVPIESEFDKHLAIDLIKSDVVDEYKFPIINNYNEIYELNAKIFNQNNISIHFVEHKSIETDIEFKNIFIEFTINDYNKNKTIDKCTNIINDLLKFF